MPDLFPNKKAPGSQRNPEPFSAVQLSVGRSLLRIVKPEISLVLVAGGLQPGVAVQMADHPAGIHLKSRRRGLGMQLSSRAVCTLTNGFSKPSKGNRYLRATACGGKVTLPGAGNTEAHSSGALSAMMGCNCLVEIPAGSGPVEPGTEVEVLCFVQ